MEPTPERFHALARSSPWRWSTLRYTLSHRPDHGRFGGGVRVWLRRPNLLRAEDLDGQILVVRRDEPAGRPPHDQGRGTVQLPAVGTAVPVVGEDGLVRERPSRREFDYDDPMLENYYDVAMLDPVELADGHDGQPGTSVERLRAVDHRARSAWEAVVRPTASYDPRCSCCALLLSEAAARLQARAGGPGPRDADPAFEVPDAHRVRLDVATGICVESEQLGGSRAGWGHDVRIEAVDGPMADDLFPSRQPRPRWRLLGGR